MQVPEEVHMDNQNLENILTLLSQKRSRDIFYHNHHSKTVARKTSWKSSIFSD